MSDELKPDPATDLVEGAADSAATRDGGKSDIAADLRNALTGEPDATANGSSAHEDMRRQIGEALAQETGQPDDQAQDGKPGRQRGPDGKFIAAQPEQQADAQPVDPNAPPAQEAPKGPPAAWKKELQARWNEIPAEFQAEIQRREADVEKGFEKYKKFRDHEPVLDFIEQAAPKVGTTPQQLLMQYAQIQDAMFDPSKRVQVLGAIAKAYGVEHVSPEVMTVAQGAAKTLGISSDQLVGNLLTIGQALYDPKTKRQAIDYLVKQFGIDMNAPTQAQEPAWVDPDIAELRNQQQQIINWQRQQEQIAEQAAQQYQHQMLNQTQARINQFAEEKGPDGQLLRPHFQAVMPTMAASIAQVKAANPSISDQDALQQAYDQAVWGNPTIRQQLLSAQMAADESKRNQIAKERAQAAARGAVSPATASPQGPPAAQPLKGDIRDQMRATLEAFTT